MPHQPALSSSVSNTRAPRSTHVVWCDGSSLSQPDSLQFGAGAVIWSSQLTQLKTAYRYWVPITRMGSIDCELLAAIVALEQVPLECHRVILVADSQEVIDACNALNVRRAPLDQVHPFNIQLFLTLRTLLSEMPGREYLFLKVKGHALSPGNVLADKLATQARKEKQSHVEMRKLSRGIAQEARSYVRGEVPVLSGKTVRVAGALVPAARADGTLKTSALTSIQKAQVKEQTHIQLEKTQLVAIKAQAQRLRELAEALPARTKNQIAAKNRAMHSAATYASRAARSLLKTVRLKALVKDSKV